MKQIKMVKNIFTLLSFLLIFSSSITNLHAQSNDDCLSCHSDDSMTMEKNGKEVSIYVNENVLKPSAHGKLSCISCHTGFDYESIPHKENITPIDCKTCHKSAPLKHSFHKTMIKSESGKNGSREVSCKGCHGTHNVVSIKSGKSKWSMPMLVETCGTCHPKEKDQFAG